MPKFFTAYETCGTRPSPAGDGFELTFEYKIGKNGVKELVQTGKTNLYDKIQASAPQCEVYSILERYDNGDYSVLQKAKGQFGDFTQFPTTLAERQQQLIDAERMFGELPLAVRREFGGDFNRFLASFEDGSYKDIFKKYVKEEPAVQETAKPSVVEPQTTQQSAQQPNFNPLQQGGSN